jgi:hypothetical protein
MRRCDARNESGECDDERETFHDPGYFRR